MTSRVASFRSSDSSVNSFLLNSARAFDPTPRLPSRMVRLAVSRAPSTSGGSASQQARHVTGVVMMPGAAAPHERLRAVNRTRVVTRSHMREPFAERACPGPPRQACSPSRFRASAASARQTDFGLASLSHRATATGKVKHIHAVAHLLELGCAESARVHSGAPFRGRGRGEQSFRGGPGTGPVRSRACGSRTRP